MVFVYWQSIKKAKTSHLREWIEWEAKMTWSEGVPTAQLLIKFEAKLWASIAQSIVLDCNVLNYCVLLRVRCSQVRSCHKCVSLAALFIFLAEPVFAADLLIIKILKLKNYTKTSALINKWINEWMNECLNVRLAKGENKWCVYFWPMIWNLSILSGQVGLDHLPARIAGSLTDWLADWPNVGKLRN